MLKPKSPAKIRKDEQGNVMFLILVVVILFAALSYAATSSTRSSDGGIVDDQSLVQSAQITQYPANVKAAVDKMTIFGTDLVDLEFNPPSTFGSLTSTNVGVFHPSGGATVSAAAPKDIMANDQPGTWAFNCHYEVENIGTSAAGNLDGNDLIAFLHGVRLSICSKINEELNIASIPVSTLGAGAESDITMNMDNAYVLPATEHEMSTANGFSALSGQGMGCFQTSGGDYVYYYVLAER